jgi:septum site-determining protein MinD
MTAKTLGVISIKGGVGKTVTTCNIGTALAELGNKVLLVDADFTSPNLALHLGVLSPKNTLHHVFKDRVTAYEAVQNYRENLDILPCSLIGERLNPFLLKEKLAGLRNLYDYILIDSAPTLSATLHAVKMARKKKTPIMGLVLNKVRGRKFELTSQEIEEASGVGILGVVRDDVHVPGSVAGTVATLEHRPRARSSRAFRKIAAEIAGVDYDKSVFGSLRNWFGSRGR